jgi:hypothetical protein
MNRPTLAFCAAASLAALGAQAQAPVDSPTIATDRPAVANSSVVVPEGGFQVENGFLATDTGGGHVVDFPESNLRYGLLQKTELRLAVPDYFRGLSGDSAQATGIGDMALGLKQQLGPLGGFDVSLIAFTSLPTGADQVSSHGYDPGVQLPWSRTLTGALTAGGQLASYWPTQNGRRNVTREATFFLDRQLSAPCDAFVEYAADFPQTGGSRQILHVGTAYKLAAHHQVDFHVAAGLSAAAPRSFVGFGYSYLFLRR